MQHVLPSSISHRLYAVVLSAQALAAVACAPDASAPDDAELGAVLSCDDDVKPVLPPGLDAGSPDAGRGGTTDGDAGGWLDAGEGDGGTEPVLPASGVTIDGVETRGCGGPAGQASKLAIADDGRTFDLSFSSFRGTGTATTSCAVLVQFTPPPGFRARLASFVVDGTVDMPVDGSSTLQGLYHFSGRQKTASLSTLHFDGLRPGRFSSLVEAQDRGDLDGDCGPEEISLDLRATRVYRAGEAGSEQLRVDEVASVEVRRIHSAMFELERCESP